MKTIILCIIFFVALQSESFSQVPRTITYQGIIQKAGAPFSGEGSFMFTLYRGSQVVWSSPALTIPVVGGLFSTILGPFPDSMRFAGIDSLGIVFDGAALSPRIAFTSVVYSLYAQRATFADSSANPGLPGAKGESGQAGVPGLKGDKGDKGVKGDSGAPGWAIGLKGDKGDNGVKGDSGSPGLAGLKGDKGLDGSIGVNGVKGDSGTPGLAGLKGDKGLDGAIGPPGNQGLQGNKGDKGVSAVPLTISAQSANILSLNNVALVWSGDALTLSLQNGSSPAVDANYSAFWHATNAVGTGNGVVASGSQVVFDVHLAYQFTIMVKVGNQWGKIDLFRVDLAATDWYGFATSN